MAVGFWVDPILYKVGTGDFLHSFFSNICYHLEGGNWGSKFPLLMNQLYKQQLDVADIDKALRELNEVETAFSEISPEKVIWDIDDLTKKAPWGNNIAPTITSLANYFVSSEGKNLFDVLKRAMNAGKEIEENVMIKSI